MDGNMRKLKINNYQKVIKDVQAYFKKVPEGDFLLRLNAILLIAQGAAIAQTLQNYFKNQFEPSTHE